jgi:hypothetical protein
MSKLSEQIVWRRTSEELSNHLAERIQEVSGWYAEDADGNPQEPDTKLDLVTAVVQGENKVLRHPLPESKVDELIRAVLDGTWQKPAVDDTKPKLQLVVPPVVATAVELIQKVGVAEAESILVKALSAKQDEVAQEAIDDFTPSTIEPPLPGPPIPEEAFHGPAGEIIKKLRPQTEAHPMAILTELLSVFGNIVGRNAHFQVEDSKLFANIFCVSVGQSSKARKGTGSNRVGRIAEHLDQEWYQQRRTGGLGSGEIVVHLVRDPRYDWVKDKKTGGLNWELVDAGVSDKRLFVNEGEFAAVLAVANRKDNVLSSILRDAWDAKELRNMAKSGSSVCLYPHISISANITREELLLQMREADRFNGFANRFLWCYVERQGLLPHGGDPIDWDEEIIKLHECISFAQKPRRVFMDRNARLMWERMYKELSTAAPGIVGAVTSRGEAQVCKLALIYSLLDKAEHITTDHLKAAKSVWDYCESSARLIFRGGASKEETQLVQFLEGKSKTMTEILKELYKKNRKVGDIRRDLDRLISLKRVAETKDAKGKPIFTSTGAL